MRLLFEAPCQSEFPANKHKLAHPLLMQSLWIVFACNQLTTLACGQDGMRWMACTLSA